MNPIIVFKHFMACVIIYWIILRLHAFKMCWILYFTLNLFHVAIRRNVSSNFILFVLDAAFGFLSDNWRERRKMITLIWNHKKPLNEFIRTLITKPISPVGKRFYAHWHLVIWVFHFLAIISYLRRFYGVKYKFHQMTAFLISFNQKYRMNLMVPIFTIELPKSKSFSLNI